MALILVTGGTTGLADGTEVDVGTELQFSGLSPSYEDAHIRCDPNYWSDDLTFDVPTEVEISFNAGSTWYGVADNPISAPEVEDVNFPVRLRQTVGNPTPEADLTLNDGATFNAISALSTPTLTATANGETQIDLSWTNVANEDGYTIEVSSNGSDYSALTTKDANVTTHSHTGLSAGTHRWYRVKAEGSGRYSDSGWGTDDATTATGPVAGDTFTDTNDVLLSSHAPSGPYGTGTWSLIYQVNSNHVLAIYSNALRAKLTSGFGNGLAIYKHSTSVTDGAVEVAFKHKSSGASAAYVYIRTNSDFSTRYWAAVSHSTGDVQLFKKVGGGADTEIGSWSKGSAFTADHVIKIEAIGTAIKVYVDGTERISVTDASIASGTTGLGLSSPAAEGTANGFHADDYVVTEA